MLLIPAIDIKEGRCVRLRQGDMEQTTVFEADPRDAAKRWVEDGAQRLHIVDLDGAVRGEPVNAGIVNRITQAYPDVPVQIGGGIRSMETIEAYLRAGVGFVIIGTRAVRDPGFVAEACTHFPHHIIVGLDARQGKLAVDGWSKTSDQDVIEMAKKFEDQGVVAIIYTNIARDGMLNGVDLDSTRRLAESVRIPILASGGIAGMADIEGLCAISASGVAGAITGRAIYEGTLDFRLALEYIDAYPKGRRG